MTDEPLKISQNNKLLNIASISAVILLAFASFILSFDALRNLAISSGITKELAFLWPLIVDGFIVVATTVAFTLNRKGFKVTWYPWLALILFSAVSVTGNALHAQKSALDVPVVVATIVSAIPAIALLLASHMIVLMISDHGKKESSTASSEPLSESDSRTQKEEDFNIEDLFNSHLQNQHEPFYNATNVPLPSVESTTKTAPEPAQEISETRPKGEHLHTPATSSFVAVPFSKLEKVSPPLESTKDSKAASSPEPSPDSSSAQTKPTREEAEKLVLSTWEKGQTVTVKELANALDLSESTARRWMKNFQEKHNQ